MRTDQRTNRRTDQRTDEQTKPLIETKNDKLSQETAVKARARARARARAKWNNPKWLKMYFNDFKWQNKIDMTYDTKITLSDSRWIKMTLNYLKRLFLSQKMTKYDMKWKERKQVALASYGQQFPLPHWCYLLLQCSSNTCPTIIAKVKLQIKLWKACF